jgi:hypothetical protein
VISVKNVKSQKEINGFYVILVIIGFTENVLVCIMQKKWEKNSKEGTEWNCPECD